MTILCRAGKILSKRSFDMKPLAQNRFGSQTVPICCQLWLPVWSSQWAAPRPIACPHCPSNHGPDLVPGKENISHGRFRAYILSAARGHEGWARNSTSLRWVEWSAAAEKGTKHGKRYGSVKRPLSKLQAKLALRSRSSFKIFFFYFYYYYYNIVIQIKAVMFTWNGPRQLAFPSDITFKHSFWLTLEKCCSHKFPSKIFQDKISLSRDPEDASQLV